MAFFSKVRNKETEEVSFWNKIESEEDLKQAEQDSYERQVVIFKHSTRCQISKMVKKNFEKSVIEKRLTDNYRFYFLDLLRFRKLSDEIEAHYDVVHQSPQILVIKDDKCTLHRSHTNIILNSLPQ